MLFLFIGCGFSFVRGVRAIELSLLAACEGSNPEICGCINVKQSDYRGTISSTKSGYKCSRWDKDALTSQKYPNAGLDENYCRNPDDDDQGPWCNTDDLDAVDGWEYCDIPVCEESLPSAHPSSSIQPSSSAHPTISPSSSFRPTTTSRPTTSSSPTVEPQCEGSNPEKCGCGSVYQADYRGSMSTTKTGQECMRWDETDDDDNDGFISKYPEANNYCRQPDRFLHRAYCKPVDGPTEECNVPYCFPSSLSCDDDASTNTRFNNEVQTACALIRCITYSDLKSSELVDSVAPLREDLEVDCRCDFEHWDCIYGSKGCERDTDLKDINECCRIKMELDDNTAICDCILKPECEAGNSRRCFEYAESCLSLGNDDQLKCEYQTRACHLTLERDSKEVSDMAAKYCFRADATCCGEDNNAVGGCKCDFWESLCTNYPNAKYDSSQTYGTTCNEAARICCGTGEEANEYHCKCDIYSYADTLGYLNTDDAKDLCTKVDSIVPDREIERQALQAVYNETGGVNWYNNTGWMMTGLDHCNWYGIKCNNEDKHVTEINLSSNNLAGEFPADSLSKLYRLIYLNLSVNRLSGTMAGISPYNKNGDQIIQVNDTSIFFNLQELAYADLSRNSLSGEVDVLFSPALQYANFSHNNFTSINSFKKFKRSHQTLTVCDASHNSIQSSVVDVMKHVPINIQQFLLSNNRIDGSLSSSLEHLAYLRRLDISTNMLTGELPDFISYPSLQLLDLSDQQSTGLVGTIPGTLVNLLFLSTLRLAGNQLSGSIPPVFSNFAQLKVLDLSRNKLSHSIPNELGKLVGVLQSIDLSNNTLSGLVPLKFGRSENTEVLLTGSILHSYINLSGNLL